MSIPYGKLKKSPQQNAACFVGCCIAHIDKAKGKSVNAKALKKYEKYMSRMVEIIGGKSKKCPGTYDNFLKISTELGKESEDVAQIFINLDAFTSEDRKNIIEVFGEIMKIDVDPNPISEGLAQDGNNLIDQILAKFDSAGMSIHYGNLLKVMTNQPELIKSFLRYDVFKTLSTFVWNAVFEISSEALSVLEEILISQNEDVKAEIYKFLNKHPKDIMEIFLYLFEQENYLAKRESMKIVHELLLNREVLTEFYAYYVSEKEHLKFTMISLNDESPAINFEAFFMLIIFLKAPKDIRGPKVNETLLKNSDKLIDFIEHFQEEKTDDENLSINKEIAIKALKKIQKEE